MSRQYDSNARVNLEKLAAHEIDALPSEIMRRVARRFLVLSTTPTPGQEHLAPTVPEPPDVQLIDVTVSAIGDDIDGAFDRDAFDRDAFDRDSPGNPHDRDPHDRDPHDSDPHDSDPHDSDMVQ